MKTNYLEEKPGQKSYTRLASIICLWQAIFMANLVTVKYIASPGFTIDYYLVALIVLFLLFAFAPKVAQKFAEAKFPEVVTQ